MYKINMWQFKEKRARFKQWCKDNNYSWCLDCRGKAYQCYTAYNYKNSGMFIYIELARNNLQVRSGWTDNPFYIEHLTKDDKYCINKAKMKLKQDIENLKNYLDITE